jgi:hypothetical protein
VLIVASGSIGDLDGRPVDILGLGLKGTAGLVRYLTLLAVLLGITLAAVPLAARSWRDRGIVRRLAAWLPGIGPALVAAEAAAWCRAAAMAGHAGLNAGRLVELAAGAAPGLRISAAEIESRPGADGVVELTPFEFLDRLADLVPPPRKHRHRYHGVFAPNHKLRRAVTALAIGRGLARVPCSAGTRNRCLSPAAPGCRKRQGNTGKQGQAPTAAQPEPVPRTTPPELPGRNSWPGWGRSFRSSARTAAATSG